MMRKHLLIFVFVIFLSCFYDSHLIARVGLPNLNICGKVDAGVALMRIDVLESNKTVKRINMGGIKADSSFILTDYYGLCLKPTLLYGKSGDSSLFSGGGGIGICVPFRECFTFTPSIGCLYTRLRTHVDVPTPFFLFEHVREIFTSVSPYLALDITYTVRPGWRLCGSYQYAWSRTDTKLKDLLDDKSHSEGASYAVMVEHDINQSWSIQLGGAYNLSLTKEKHGLRGIGAKLGIAYWF